MKAHHSLIALLVAHVCVGASERTENASLYTPALWNRLRTQSSVIQVFEPLAHPLAPDISSFLSPSERTVLEKWLDTKHALTYHALHALPLSEQISLLCAADKLGMETLIDKIVPYVARGLAKEIDRMIVRGEKNKYQILDSLCLGNAVLQQLLVEQLLMHDEKTFAYLYSRQITEIHPIFFSRPITQYDASVDGTHTIVWIDGPCLNLLRDDADMPEVMLFDASPTQLVLDKAGNHALLYFAQEKQLSVIDLKNKCSLWTIETHDVQPTFIALSPSARRVLMQTLDGTLYLYDTHTGSFAKSSFQYNSIAYVCCTDDEMCYGIRSSTNKIYSLFIDENRVGMKLMQTALNSSVICPDIVQYILFPPATKQLIGVTHMNTYIEFEPFNKNQQPAKNIPMQLKEVTFSWLRVDHSYDKRTFIVSDSSMPSVKASITFDAFNATYGTHMSALDFVQYVHKRDWFHAVSTDKKLLIYFSLKPFQAIAQSWNRLTLAEYVCLKSVIHAHRANIPVTAIDHKRLTRLDHCLQELLSRLRD